MTKDTAMVTLPLSEYEERTRQRPQWKLTQDQRLAVVLLTIGLSAIIMGAVLIYGMLQPIPEPVSDYQWARSMLTLLCLGVAVGWTIHGVGFALVRYR